MGNPGLYRITLTYACFGIVIHNGVCTEAAPIAIWMIGKHKSIITKWLRERNAIIEFVCEIEKAATDYP